MCGAQLRCAVGRALCAQRPTQRECDGEPMAPPDDFSFGPEGNDDEESFELRALASD